MIKPSMPRGPKDLKGKGKQQKNLKTKFETPNTRVENQQHDESFGSRKNKGKGHHGKEKVKFSYCRKGFHPENSCMKKNLDEATSLLERNHINLLEKFRRRDQQDREPQHELRSCPHGKHFEVQSTLDRF